MWTRSLRDLYYQRASAARTNKRNTIYISHPKLHLHYGSERCSSLAADVGATLLSRSPISLNTTTSHTMCVWVASRIWICGTAPPLECILFSTTRPHKLSNKLEKCFKLSHSSFQMMWRSALSLNVKKMSYAFMPLLMFPKNNNFYTEPNSES